MEDTYPIRNFDALLMEDVRRGSDDAQHRNGGGCERSNFFPGSNFLIKIPNPISWSLFQTIDTDGRILEIRELSTTGTI